MKASKKGVCPPTDLDFLKVAESFQKSKYKAFVKSFLDFWEQETPYPLDGQRMEQVFAVTYFLKQQNPGRTAKARDAAKLYDQLVLLLRETLHSTTNLAEPVQHLNLVRKILSRNPRSLDIVSFNYDVLADRTLLNLSRAKELKWSHQDGYGFKPDGAGTPKEASTCKLYKLMGQ